MNNYVGALSVAIIRDPRENSGIALLGIQQSRRAILPEDQLIKQPWNKELAYPQIDIIGLQYVTGETPESVVTRAATALETDELFLVQDKQLIVDASLTGPDMVDDMLLEKQPDVVMIGGTQMQYDAEDDVYTIPLRDITSALVGAYGRQEVCIAAQLPLADAVDIALQGLSLGTEEMETLLLAVGIGVWKTVLEYKRDIFFLEDREIEKDDLAEWGLDGR